MTVSSKIKSKISSKINSKINKLSSHKYKNIILIILIIAIIIILYLIISTFFTTKKSNYANMKESFESLTINSKTYNIINPPENMRQVSSHWDLNSEKCRTKTYNGVLGGIPKLEDYLGPGKPPFSGYPEKGYYDTQKPEWCYPGFDCISSMLDTAEGWHAFNNDSLDPKKNTNKELREWLQMDLGKVMNVSGVVTQARGPGLAGAGGYGQLVTAYRVKHSNDAITWTPVYNNEFSFLGNSSKDDINKKIGREFLNPISARYIRIYPEAFEGHISMRAGLLTLDSLTPTAAATEIFPSLFTITDTNGNPWKYNPSSDRVYIGGPNTDPNLIDLQMSIYNDNTTKYNAQSGYVALQNKSFVNNTNTPTYIRHAGFVLHSNAFGTPLFDFAWKFIPNNDGTYKIANDYPNNNNTTNTFTYYIGNNPSDSKSVLIVPTTPAAAQSWVIRPVTATATAAAKAAPTAAATAAAASATGTGIDYIKIQAAPNQYLQISQVAVYTMINGVETNIATNKEYASAKATSILPDGADTVKYRPENAVDGILEAKNFHDTTKKAFHSGNTGDRESWFLVLNKPYNITKIVYYNRSEMHDGAPLGNRAIGSILSVYNTKNNNTTDIPMYTYKLNGDLVQTIVLPNITTGATATTAAAAAAAAAAATPSTTAAAAAATTAAAAAATTPSVTNNTIIINGVPYLVIE